MNFHRWITGFFLLVVMMTALFVNAWVFSARSFQDNFSKVTGGGSGAVSMRASLKRPSIFVVSVSIFSSSPPM